MRSSCETLAMKSRRICSVRAISVTSCKTATAPPPGSGSGVDVEDSARGRPRWLCRCSTRRGCEGAVERRPALQDRARHGPGFARTRSAPGAMRCMTALDQPMRPSASTAMTASCMLSSKAASSRCLDSSAWKLASRRAAVVSSAWATVRDFVEVALRHARGEVARRRFGWRRATMRLRRAAARWREKSRQDDGESHGKEGWRASRSRRRTVDFAGQRVFHEPPQGKVQRSRADGEHEDEGEEEFGEDSAECILRVQRTAFSVRVQAQ